MGCQVSTNCLQNHQRKYKFSARLLHSSNDTPNNPENSLHHSAKSDGNDFDNRLDMSISSYQQFLQENSDLRYPFDGLGNPEDQVGYFETKVESWYEVARENGRINGNPFDALSLCYSLKKDVSQGKKWYEGMVAKHPMNQYLHFGLGNIYYKLEMFDEAQQQYRQTIAINPRLDKAYQNIANIYCFKKFDNARAEEWSRFALKINPKNEYALLINAVVNENINFQIHHLQKLLQSHKNYARVYNALGHAYMQKCKYKTAVKWLLDGYSKNSSYFAIPCGLALAYNKLGKFDQAIQWSNKSMELHPNHHEPYLSLGDAYRGKGQTQEAKKWYLRCVQINSQFDEAYLKLASVFTNENDQKAIKYYEKYLQRNHEDSQIIFILAKLHIKRKQTHVAVNYLLSMPNLSTQQQAIFLLAQSLQSLKKPTESDLFFKQYIKNAEDKEEAKKRVAKVYQSNGANDRMTTLLKDLQKQAKQ